MYFKNSLITLLGREMQKRLQKKNPGITNLLSSSQRYIENYSVSIESLVAALVIITFILF